MMNPLSNLIVLDLTRLLPGPLCSLYLADFGARVIKIEDPKSGGDPMRFLPQIFNQLNRNKESVALNLKDENDLEKFYKLVQRADVIIEGFRPEVPPKLKIDYETLKKINPKIIYCSITGYGQSGPLKNFAGHDLNYMSLSGTVDQIGSKNSKPQMLNIQVSDIAGGSLMSCIGILTAIIGRSNNGGLGRYIDISMLDTTLSLNLVPLASLNRNSKVPQRGDDLLSGKYPHYQIYETSDERYLALCAFEEKFWINFCEHVKRLDWVKFFPHGAPNAINEIAHYFKQNSFDYWTHFFKDVDCCLTPILNLKEAIESEQIKSRNLVLGELGNYSIANPIKMSDYNFKVNNNAPKLGENRITTDLNDKS